MARLLGFLVLAFVLAGLLRHVPVVGPFFAHTGIFGVWLAALGLSYAATRFGERALVRRRMRAELERLGRVDNAYNQGKAGSLLLARGEVRRALPYLERAAEGEPRSADWHYKLGSALLALGRAREARQALGRALELDPEHAYGAAELRLAQALAADGAGEEALSVLARVERNHGPTPEAAYRRGQVLRSLGRRAEARASFAEVQQLAQSVPAFQRPQARALALRALFLRYL